MQLVVQLHDLDHAPWRDVIMWLVFLVVVLDLGDLLVARPGTVIVMVALGLSPSGSVFTARRRPMRCKRPVLDGLWDR
jgi:hypothetical protein